MREKAVSFKEKALIIFVIVFIAIVIVLGFNYLFPKDPISYAREGTYRLNLTEYGRIGEAYIVLANGNYVFYDPNTSEILDSGTYELGDSMSIKILGEKYAQVVHVKDRQFEIFLVEGEKSVTCKKKFNDETYINLEQCTP